MGCEPCKNYRCQYEHQKLIEQVRKLERDYKSNHALTLDELNDVIKKQEKEIKSLQRENAHLYEQLNERTKNYVAAYGKLEDEHTKTKVRLMVSNLAVLGGICWFVIYFVRGFIA